MIKAIAIDLDGTLLNDEHLIDSETLDIIRNLRSKDIKVGIATGRPYFNIIFDDIDIPSTFDFCICNNGADCYDFIKNETHHQYLLPKDVVLDIYNKYKHFGAVAVVTDDNVMYPEKDNEFITMLPDEVKIDLDNFHNKLEQDHPKLIYNVTPIQQMKMIEYNKNNPSSKYRSVISQHNLVEFVHPKLSKVSGLEWFASNHNLTLNDFMAFGDSGNDIEMIEECKIGVAMKNALPFVRDRADYIAGSNKELGVYNFLSKFFMVG